jgi:menaquinone-dependent protoporphyrinogen oxidase
MSNILAIYGTSYGHTERIVHRIREVLSNAGHEVTLIRGDRLPPDLPLTRYDGFLIAASVLFGRHQRYIRGFVRRHAERLNVAPSALVSVCDSAGGRSPEEQQAAKGYIDRLLQRDGLAAPGRPIDWRRDRLHPLRPDHPLGHSADRSA